MIGSTVITESGDELLDANAFVVQSFECNDRIFPNSLKFSLLRKRGSEDKQVG